MKVLILGAGMTGTMLARELIADGHRITLVDIELDRVQAAGNELDCAIVRAEERSLETLERAGLASADALVAMSDSDELNMIACALTDAVYPKVLKIARVCNNDYCRFSDEVRRRCAPAAADGPRPLFGVDWVMNPNREVVKSLVRRFAQQRTCAILALYDGFSLVAMTLGPASPLVGRPLGCLQEVRGWHYRVVYICDDEGKSALPRDAMVLEAGCQLGILVRTADISELAKLCDATRRIPLNVLLVGGEEIVSLLITGMQVSSDYDWESWMPGVWRGRVEGRLAVVDESPARCRELADRFEGLKVFCGDVTDPELVRETGLDSYEMSLSFSSNYDRNLITAASLKASGVRTAVALTASGDVMDMATKLDVDLAVPIRETMVASIRNRLYGRHVLYVETVAQGTYDLLDCTLPKRAKMPEGAVVLLERRKGEDSFCEPVPGRPLEAGDRVLLMMPVGQVEAVRKSFD